MYHQDNGSGVRDARLEDVEGIYRLCCKVGLSPDVERARNKGFLVTDYINHPEVKELFEYDISTRGNPFYVCERDCSIAGVLIGYSREQWMGEESIRDLWEGVSWDEDALADMGITDINDCDFAVLAKIATDPDVRKSGISSGLLRNYSDYLKGKWIPYVLSLVVADTYDGDGDKSLGIENSVSKGFHEKIGARKVGDSGIVAKSKTYLDDGRFRYHVFMQSLE